jgi:hypothetical protein
MKCEHAARLLDQYLDGSLSPAAAGEVRSHLKQCPDCRAEQGELTALRRLLAALPAPPVRMGVLERMLNTAVAPVPSTSVWHMPVWYRAAVGAAAVLLLAVGFGLGVHVAGRKPAGPQVVLTAQAVQLGSAVQRVGLMFRASEALADASISVSLPDDVEIAGRPQVRHLSWRTDLKAGPNLLELPLLATGPGSGTLVVRLSQGSLVRILEIPITVRGPHDPGAASLPAPETQALT